MIDREKRSKTPNEVKAVKNIKNAQSFLNITPMQNNVPPSHKLQDQSY